MKYVKKPIPVEAIRWTGDNTDEIRDFISTGEYNIRGGSLYIHTLEGDMLCPIGSYVIKGVEGEFYPCYEDIFNKTYAPYKE